MTRMWTVGQGVSECGCDVQKATKGCGTRRQRQATSRVVGGQFGGKDYDDGKEANRQREIQGVVVVVEVLEACVRHT